MNISYLGMVIERLGEAQSRQKQYAQAFDSYKQALAKYDTAIKQAPDDFGNYALKAGGLTSLADLQLSLSKYTQALEYYQRAVACYDISLALKPMKGIEFDQALTLQKLGRCFCQLSRNTEALETYELAMKVFSRLPPDDKHLRYLNEQIQKLNSLD